jgi:hypothetical protein
MLGIDRVTSENLGFARTQPEDFDSPKGNYHDHRRRLQEKTSSNSFRASVTADLGLLEVTDKVSHKPAAAIVAVTFDGATYEFVPVARMLDGNPYEELDPRPPRTHA